MIYWNNDNKISVRITDLTTGNPVDDATVKVSYYRDRSHLHPDQQPGTVLTGLENITLVHDTDGWYSVQVEESVVPGPGAFTRVVDASTPGGGNGHWEDLITVKVRKSTDN